MRWMRWIAVVAVVLFIGSGIWAQETTGGLQGTVKDPTGAVVAGAHIVLTGTTLVGSKEIDSDSAGYYHFTNLPPGTYELTITATGFSTLKQGGITIEVGHLPTIDLALQLGSVTSTVEVTSAPPLIDATTNVTQTNLTENVLQNVPTGLSYQSVIQFAPGARNEPLAGNNMMAGAGTGGSSISSSSNGLAYGYSIGGASDSENSYLIEGQDTSNIAGGYSMANIPFNFVQEVEIKSTGMDAQYGTALGGVVNVVTKKGSNVLHGNLNTTFRTDAADAGPNPYPRYDPASTGNPAVQLDAAAQSYQPLKDHYRIMQVGGTLGGALIKDRVWFFAGFQPEVDTLRREVNFDQPGNDLGEQGFNQNQNYYYTVARIDAAVTKKITLYASWLYQYSRMTGNVLPDADSANGLLNLSTTEAITNFPGSVGFTAPNQMVNVGADITISHALVATTRFGYFMQNYHDFGYPTGFPAFWFQASGIGAYVNSPVGCTPPPATGAQVACTGTIPAGSALSQTDQFLSANDDTTFTPYNYNKHNQFNQDLDWYKSGWLGTHNFKFGYQLNYLLNRTLQRANLPELLTFPGVGNTYAPETSTGIANCAAIEAANGVSTGCTGNDGYLYIQDTGTAGKADSYNNALYAQDAWNIGKGVTLNIGIRDEKEYLPAYLTYEGLTPKPINFGWNDKIAPRFGAAWDVHQNGKMKIFGSYGVYYDTMKLNLAISSFGGQYWNNCVYAINSNPADIATMTSLDDFSYNSAGRGCEGLDPTQGAVFSNGSIPSNLAFIENVNNRSPEYVQPGIKPYRQHESTLGVDYQISPTLAFEARWDRRRLDNAIEDSALINPVYGESSYIIVNPGKAPNNTFDSFATNNYTLNNPLFGCNTPGTCYTGPGGTNPAGSITTGPSLLSTLPSVECPSCPPPPTAQRSYDAVEFRLTTATIRRFSGMFSYTYSDLRGNYSGLTSTDQRDSADLYGGGRSSPNNSRYFDEPWFSYTADGTPDNGPLGTDRPNVLKGYGYYTLPWGGSDFGKRNSTSFGLFQYFYQGTPLTSYADTGYYYGGIAGEFNQYLVGAGQWVNLSQSSGGGPITVGSIGPRRTPWYIESDFQLQHQIKLGADEAKALVLTATIPNIFNQKSVTAYNSQVDSAQLQSFLQPDGLSYADGGPFFLAAMKGFDWQSTLNSSGVILNSNYGKPLYYQLPRLMRFGLQFNF